ncbi:uncharacterized protein LOC129581263 [Paramacrobiotus metropolitanus]|uniref:uncharacterized protein LOC129581263 n=1 Tax=Paramacrobiotus metropolitanus TaxID=2943436 RepID=UPI002445E93C|nr:uncharacterized protein LOC129581263 [Paramacrobiotus metropolitanus]
MEQIVPGGKVFFPFALGMLLVNGLCTATAPASRVSLVPPLGGPLDPSASAAEQIQMLADCVVTISDNYRRLTDANHRDTTASVRSTAPILNASSTPSAACPAIHPPPTKPRPAQHQSNPVRRNELTWHHVLQSLERSFERQPVCTTIFVLFAIYTLYLARM